MCSGNSGGELGFRAPAGALALRLLLFVVLSLTNRTWGDGVFVAPPFSWNKARDINEPSQKAIILFDAGREDLILQVKYEGPVEEFGWLIPVPSQPTVTRASMESSLS
jgi:hypothetical protein